MARPLRLDAATDAEHDTEQIPNIMLMRRPGPGKGWVCSAPQLGPGQARC